MKELALLDVEACLDCEVFRGGSGRNIPPAGGPVGDAKEDNDGED